MLVPGLDLGLDPDHGPLLPWVGDKIYVSRRVCIVQSD